jgi:hypothetical protein
MSPPDTPTPTSSRAHLGKRSSSGTNRDQPPVEPIFSRHKSPSSPRTRSPPPRVVTPRGFTSTSTSSLNYPPSYSSNALRRSSIDRRSPSPALPRAASPSTPSRPRALSPGPQQQRHSLPIFSHDAPDKYFHFVALTCRSFKSHPPRSGAHGHFGALQGDAET